MHFFDDVSHALAHWSDLLEREQRGVRARSDALLANQSRLQLEENGVLLYSAVILDEEPSLGGRIRLTLGARNESPAQIDVFDVRVGAMVRVVPRFDKNFDVRQLSNDDAITGVVARKNKNQLQVIFDGNIDFPETSVSLLKCSDEYILQKLQNICSQFTWQRLQTQSPQRATLWQKVLGVVPVRVPQIPAQVFHKTTVTLDGLINTDQNLAIQKAQYAPDVALIHGPPGTGKTHALVELIRRCLLDAPQSQPMRILATAPANAAADHLAAALLRADPTLRLVRVGHPARVSAVVENATLSAQVAAHPSAQLAAKLLKEAFQQKRQLYKRSSRSTDAAKAKQEQQQLRQEVNALFADAKKLEQQAINDILDRAQIIVGTLTGFDDHIPYGYQFDLAVVDEASQALTPAILLAAAKANRLVLAGDPQQLPPTVISPDASGLADTLMLSFQKAAQPNQKNKKSSATDEVGVKIAQCMHMLTVQHRMHEAIMRWPSERFYHNQLTAHSSVAAHTLLDLSPTEEAIIDEVLLLDRPFDVIDTAGAGYDESQPEGSDSRCNREEAALVAALTRRFLAAGFIPKHLGVIAPYSAQVSILRDLLRDVVDQGLEVDSVDGFQGREKEIILWSTVRSNIDGEVGFLADERRLNVAITRAKRKLVVIGDSATLGNHSLWQKFFADAAEVGSHRSVFELMGLLDDISLS